MLAFLASQLCLVSCAQALGIFLPLDVGPGQPGTRSGWSRVISSISANPQIPFFSIVNPNDGPGNAGSQPSDAFRQCVQSLRPRSNTIVLGYVNTETGRKSILNVQVEIDTYAGWNSSYRPTGILFDGASSDTSLVNQYGTYATYARSKGFNFIGLNPGEMSDPGYFSIADLVNVYESSYASFNTGEDVSDSPSTPASKQSVWLTRAPITESYIPMISQMVNKGLAAVYISDLPDDELGIPSQWTSFVADVDKASAVPGSPAPPGTNATAVDSSTSTTGGLNTGVSNAPQSTGGPGRSQPSGRPPVGAIVGGTLGGLVVLSVALIINRRNRRSRDHSAAREQVARPFISSQSSPLENDPPIIGEKPLTRVVGNIQVGTPNTGGNYNASPTSQSIPSSSAVTALSDSQPGPTTGFPIWGETSTHRASNVEPPPHYSP